MVTLIVGKKGSGKTKRLIDMVEKAVNDSSGNIVVIEKGPKLTYDLTYKARLINIEQYNISGYDSFFGFLSGICAANYDTSYIFVDSTFKICGYDQEQFSEFVSKISKISSICDTKLVISVSLDGSEIPEDLNKQIEIA